MNVVYWLLLVQGVFGAFDTVYFHEWRARLPAHVPDSSPELTLHAMRDFLYAIIFGTTPWIEWHGWAAVVFVGVLLCEIVLTMLDFVIEPRVRKRLGDVYPAERVTHAAMGITYGAMLACLIPVIWTWWSHTTGFVRTHPTDPPWIRWILSVFAVGVLLSGARDLLAVTGSSLGSWPWRRRREEAPAEV